MKLTHFFETPRLETESRSRLLETGNNARKLRVANTAFK